MQGGAGVRSRRRRRRRIGVALALALLAASAMQIFGVAHADDPSCTDLTGTTPSSPVVLDGTECGELLVSSPLSISGTIGPDLTLKVTALVTLVGDLTNNG